MAKFVLMRKKERWTVTWLGNLLKLVILVTLILLFSRTIHPFLAQNEPVVANILILEGFVPDYIVEEAMNIFYRDQYQLLIITGKKRQKGAQLDAYANDGEFTAATLEILGMDMTRVVVVAEQADISRDRTYASAVAVKEWIIQSGAEISRVNLITQGCHARRSRLLFEKALGRNTKIGIIAAEDQSYDTDKWWKSSQGFREVTKETIAWIYARFFFYPGH